MALRTIAFAMLLLLLAACAAIPGYTPPPFKKNDSMKGMTSGDMDAEGTYHMSNQEKDTDCSHLRGAMMVTISRLRQQGDGVPSSPLAIGANKAATTLLGGSAKGFDSEADAQRDRARLLAYNRHLAAQGCKTVDIEAELARPREK
jgi:hypothetical protein